MHLLISADQQSTAVGAILIPILCIRKVSFRGHLCLFLLRGKNQGARIGYLKATLIPSETEDLQKSLGLCLPAGADSHKGSFLCSLFVSGMEHLQVGRRGQAARQVYEG